MFAISDAQKSINSTERHISHLKRQAVWLRFAAYSVRLVGIVLFLTGAVKALALSPANLFTMIFRNLGILVWTAMAEHFAIVWSVVLAISPYPRLTEPSPILSWAGWILLYVGILALGTAMVKRANSLKADATELQRALNVQVGLLLQLHAVAAQVQSNRVGNISGDGNTVNAIN